MSKKISRPAAGIAELGLVLAMLIAAGCSVAGRGALIGSGVGAAAGAGIDHGDRGRGALAGAVIGAVSGYFVGNEIDKRHGRDGEFFPPAPRREGGAHGPHGHRPDPPYCDHERCRARAGTSRHGVYRNRPVQGGRSRPYCSY